MIARKIAFSAAGVTIVASAVLASAASAKDEPLVLRPSTEWNLQFAGDSCRLQRFFGEGKDRVALVIDQYEPGDLFSMVVAGRPVKKLGRTAKPSPVSIQFGPSDASFEPEAWFGDLGELKPAAIFMYAALGPWTAERRGEPAAEQGDETIDVLARGFTAEDAARIEWLELKKNKSIRLATGPMGETVKGLQICMADLMARWGLDVEAHRKLTRRAQPLNDIDDWLLDRDYPIMAVRAGSQGMVHYRLIVDEHGKPVDCSIQGATEPADFSKVTCARLIRRAEFQPALDAEGQPIKSVFLSSVSFVID